MDQGPVGSGEGGGTIASGDRAAMLIEDLRRQERLLADGAILPMTALSGSATRSDHGLVDRSGATKPVS
jgi:hypothetical protein